MNKRKVFKYLIIACISLLLFSSIVGTLVAAEKKVLIGLAFATLESDFWQSLKNVTIENAEKLGAETTVVSADHDIARQMAQMEDLIAKGVNAIILNAVDADAIVPIVNAAAEKGIAVITIDRAISDKANFTCYVGTDNILAGKIAAKYVAEKLGGKGKVVVLNGPPEALVSRHRNEGYVSGLSEYPGIEIVAQKWGSADRSINMNNMEDILTTFPDVVAVFGFSDGNSLGAADAIISRGLQNKILIGSIDGMQEVAKLMLGKDFPIIISIAQDPRQMAKYAALVAYEAAIGNRVPASINTWIKAVIPDNAEEYLNSGIFD